MPRPVKVLFVCLHGAAKSVIAAEYLGRLARSTVSDGYGPARDAIIGRLRTFLADMSVTDSRAVGD